MASKFGIRGVIFFEDYSLYARCRLASVEQHIKVTDFIAQCCEKYLNTKNGVTKDYKTSDALYVDCKKTAEGERISIAALVEKACAEVFGSIPATNNITNIAPTAVEEKKKGSIFDLNRDAKR
jgi:hypothetical protein